MTIEDAYALANRMLVRLADGQIGRLVVFRLRSESVDVQLPGGQLRTMPSKALQLKDGYMVELTA
jgi:hypothetical protein